VFRHSSKIRVARMVCVISCQIFTVRRIAKPQVFSNCRKCVLSIITDFQVSFVSTTPPQTMTVSPALIGSRTNIPLRQSARYVFDSLVNPGLEVVILIGHSLSVRRFTTKNLRSGIRGRARNIRCTDQTGLRAPTPSSPKEVAGWGRNTSRQPSVKT